MANGPSAALSVLKVAATLAAGFMNATPLTAAATMVRTQSTANVSPIPFAMVAFNGAVWSIYGVVIRNWVPLVAANVIGVVAGVAALVAHQMHAPQSTSTPLFAYVVAVLFVVGCTRDAMLDPAGLGAAVRGPLGAFSVGVTVCMFASPLVVVRDVVRTRSTAALSPVMTAAALASSTLWFAYGAIIDDVFVWLPNVAGLVLSAAQVALFWRFGGCPAWAAFPAVDAASASRRCKKHSHRGNGHHHHPHHHLHGAAATTPASPTSDAAPHPV